MLGLVAGGEVPHGAKLSPQPQHDGRAVAAASARWCADRRPVLHHGPWRDVRSEPNGTRPSRPLSLSGGPGPVAHLVLAAAAAAAAEVGGCGTG